MLGLMKTAWRMAHFPLLALWAVSILWVGRAMASERHYCAAINSVKDLSRRIEVLERATELNPWFDWPHASLGEAYTATREWEKAVQHTGRALELGFYLGTARQLASAYMEMADAAPEGTDPEKLKALYAKAYQKFEEIVLYYPVDEASLFRLGYIAMKQGRSRTAEQFVSAYLRHHNPTSEIYYVWFRALEQQSFPRRAMHYAHRFHSLPRSDVLPWQIYEKGANFTGWPNWLRTWDIFIHKVEMGIVTPQPGQVVK
jgi:tetratricopeptide (TPR) repeat protein